MFDQDRNKDVFKLKGIKSLQRHLRELKYFIFTVTNPEKIRRFFMSIMQQKVKYPHSGIREFCQKPPKFQL